MPGYFLRTQEQAAAYIETLALPNVRLQFDFFHCQMEQGNVSGRLRRFFPLIGHCQAAGVPDRQEPDGASSIIRIFSPFWTSSAIRGW